MGAWRRTEERFAQIDKWSLPEPEADDHPVVVHRLRWAAPVAPVEVDSRHLARPENVHERRTRRRPSRLGEIRDVNLSHGEPLPMPEEADAWDAKGERARRATRVREQQSACRAVEGAPVSED